MNNKTNGQILDKQIVKNNLKIYKNRKLTNASFEQYLHSDYQVFLQLISKLIKKENGDYLQQGQLERRHVLTAKAYSEQFNVDLSNAYKQLKKACDKLMGKTLKIEKLENKEKWIINICSSTFYEDNKGQITIEFTDTIMPYLAQVKEKFVLYNLKEISNFSSLYSIRLYDILQAWKNMGKMEISVENLKTRFGVSNKYKDYSRFKQKTFGIAIKEINREHWHLNLKFKEIKQGKKVVRLLFTFKANRREKNVPLLIEDQQKNGANSLLDSESKEIRLAREKVADKLSHVAGILCSIDPNMKKLAKTELSQAKKQLKLLTT